MIKLNTKNIVIKNVKDNIDDDVWDNSWNYVRVIVICNVMDNIWENVSDNVWANLTDNVWEDLENHTKQI